MSAKQSQLPQVAKGFAFLSVMLKLRGRRLDRLYLQSSRFRKWLTVSHFEQRS